jgi:DNA-binding CsgD family transcriptional regulator
VRGRALRKFEQSLPDFLLDVYEAAANPQHWQVLLQRIANEMEATKASIHVHSFSGQSWEKHTAGTRVHRFGYDESAASAYAKYYAVRDPYIQRIRERFPRDGSGTSSDLLTITELRRTEFYSDYGRANGIFFLGWTIIEQNERFGSGLSLIRPEDAKQFTSRQVALLKLLKPHLAKAFRLQRIIEGNANNNKALLASIAQFDFGVIALDDEGQITNLSARAKNLLDEQDGIRVHASRLQAVHASENHRLQEMLTSANRVWVDPNQSTNSTLLISRRSGKRPLQLVVFPFASSALLVEERPHVLVFLSDPESKPASRAAVLRGLYGLTPTESRLADLLLQGLEVRDAAERLRTTLETARFYVKRILAKTGTRRQTDLIRLMLSLPGR